MSQKAARRTGSRNLRERRAGESTAGTNTVGAGWNLTASCAVHWGEQYSHSIGLNEKIASCTFTFSFLMVRLFSRFCFLSFINSKFNTNKNKTIQCHPPVRLTKFNDDEGVTCIWAKVNVLLSKFDPAIMKNCIFCTGIAH